MTTKKQMIIHNDAPSKGKINTNNAGMIAPHASNHEHATDDANCFLSQSTTTSAQLPLYKDQILQMLTDMK